MYAPMEFTIDHARWDTNQNRAPPRHVSTGKRTALDALLDNQLDLGVIQPSKAIAWSQVHLVWKPKHGGWRFTIDFRSLNKVISNEEGSSPT